MTSSEMSPERIAAARMPSVQGDVALMPIADVVAWLANKRMSATLNVRRGQMDTKFIIREGMLCQASSSDPREYLGQHLINFGYIDEDQLQKAFETQQETHVPLGRVLVMVDAVTHELGVERFHLAGNSMGGRVAWHYALDHPERLDRLILVDASGFPAPADEETPIGFALARTPGVQYVMLFVTPRSIIDASLRDAFADRSFVGAHTSSSSRLDNARRAKLATSRVAITTTIE